MTDIQERIYILSSCAVRASVARETLGSGVFACLPDPERKNFTKAFRALSDLDEELRENLRIVQKEQRFTK